jgi:hypothetical protein
MKHAGRQFSYICVLYWKRKNNNKQQTTSRERKKIMKNILDRIPTHPAYCLVKLQNSKHAFQQRRLACQQKIEYSKRALARKGREITEIKRNLDAVLRQRQLDQLEGYHLAYSAEDIREFVAKQQHLITESERVIRFLQRKLKKLEGLSLVATKIVNVMEQEYQQAVLHRNSIAA